MSKTRVLIIINQLFKGGAECALINLLKNLHPEKYDIDFIIYDHIRLKGTVNLIDEIPDWIHVFNAAEEEYGIAFLKKGLHKLWRKISGGEQLYRKNVYMYVKDQRYDVAISFGEWFSCSLVALYVTARRKYIWIHADMDKATYLYPDILTLWQYFDNFLFVSEQSFRVAVERYPFLKNRGLVLHNIVDADSILRKSEEVYQLPILNEKLPMLVTVANIRPEKNHMRQIAVMKELFDRGLRFYWVNVGNLANIEHVRCVKYAIEQAGLQEYFLLTGVMDNPYPVMKRADAVCVLSEYESWSMVMTEALILGVPVIATKTSGALEQLSDNETGLLCDFTVDSIAEQIQRFLEDQALASHMRAQINKRHGSQDDLNQIESLLSDNRKKILYVFDDINYTSGARNSALLQMKYLAQHADVEAFSAEPCKDKNLISQWRIWDLSDNQEFRCLSVPFKQVLEGSYSLQSKIIRFVYTLLGRINLDSKLYEHLLKTEVSIRMSGYDTVCVVSEASKLRSCVASLHGSKKVQWIHTDYAAWSRLSSWTRAITRRDGELYAHYDTIVCLSERLKASFLTCHPQLSEKTAVIPNLIDIDRILCLADEPTEFQTRENIINMISVGRIEWEKRYDRLLEIAAELKKQRIFHWYFVGDGVLLNEMKAYCNRLGLDDCISFTGELENPFPLMKRCNLFVLFSEYEGMPVTIDEAKVLGLTILVNDVGGVADQLADTENAYLLTSREDVVETICQMDAKVWQKGKEVTAFSSVIKNNQIAETQLFDRIIKGL